MYFVYNVASFAQFLKLSKVIWRVNQFLWTIHALHTLISPQHLSVYQVLSSGCNKQNQIRCTQWLLWIEIKNLMRVQLI